jgi:hypothetical protein
MPRVISSRPPSSIALLGPPDDRVEHGHAGRHRPSSQLIKDIA